MPPAIKYFKGIIAYFREKVKAFRCRNAWKRKYYVEKMEKIGLRHETEGVFDKRT